MTNLYWGFMYMEAEMIAVDLYKDGKITLQKASILADVTVREMIDILLGRRVKGNVKLDQQKKAIKFADLKS